MPMSSEEREQITNELKKFAASMNLSDEQKNKLREFLTDAHEKLQAFREKNPNASVTDLNKKIAENRAAIRQRLEHILTPEQIGQWDAEVAKARDFLGRKAASA